MAEEVSPESKLYVKEEIEKSRKEFKEDLEKAQSKATKTFATVALIVGLLSGLGVYGLVKDYIEDTISNTTVKTLEADANDLHDKIVVYEKDANSLLDNIVVYEQQVEKFASKEELSNLKDDIKKHTHRIVLSGDEKSTGYMKSLVRVNIPDGHIIVGAYTDGGGTIFYYKEFQIEASK